MALTVSWTPRAEKGFERIIAYLQENFSEKEVKNFIKDVFDFIELLSIQPQLLQKSTSKNVYRGPVNSLTIITYRIKSRKKEIEIINIREARRKPLI